MKKSALAFLALLILFSVLFCSTGCVNYVTQQRYANAEKYVVGDQTYEETVTSLNVEWLCGTLTLIEDENATAVTLKETGENIGYVQLVAIEDGWEIGYHIAKRYTKRGYASEALWAFLPAISKAHGLSEIIGICLAENRASVRVLEKCDFRQTYRGPGQYQGRERDIVRTLWTAPSTKEEIV